MRRRAGAVLSLKRFPAKWTPVRAKTRRAAPANMRKNKSWSPRTDSIGSGLYILVLTHFLHANRYPLRWKMLWPAAPPARARATCARFLKLLLRTTPECDDAAF
jgi:hypothetical protein